MRSEDVTKCLHRVATIAVAGSDHQEWFQAGNWFGLQIVVSSLFLEVSKLNQRVSVFLITAYRMISSSNQSIDKIVAQAVLALKFKGSRCCANEGTKGNDISEIKQHCLNTCSHSKHVNSNKSKKRDMQFSHFQVESARG